MHQYTVRSVFDGLSATLQQYLSASYHIWDEDLISERRRIFETPGATHQVPFLEATPVYALGLPYDELGVSTPASNLLTRAAGDRTTGIPHVPYAHQGEALLRGSLYREDLIVATGTGSGKTESFLMPILANLVDESKGRPNTWSERGIRALLLYPMNALVNDQVSRLRRLFGSDAVRDEFTRAGLRPATFGMYTSRTPYPGHQTKDKDKRNVTAVMERLFGSSISAQLRERLQVEGKWPVKDIEMFLERGLQTDPGDIELVTRHEMQAAPPDLLVTNYSMLEYMMLRPIEAPIFSKTRDWLRSDTSNKLTVVLDEAHMYRGSGGAEVAYLLRRLQARLEVPRDRIQYILTSASLGSSVDAQEDIREFAAKLTSGHSSDFRLVTSTLQNRRSGRPATQSEVRAFAELEIPHIQNVSGATAQVLRRLANRLNEPALDSDDQPALRAYAFRLLERTAPACFVADLLTDNTLTLQELTYRAFGESPESPKAAEAMLALMAFARDLDTGRPFCSIRSHLFYRGLPGLFACINPRCCHRIATSESSLLGRLFLEPRLACECGARVYELLTHRTCGAAYLRGFVRGGDDDFLWHEASQGVWSNARLQEGQFFVVPEGELFPHANDRTLVWIHIWSGRLRNSQPPTEETNSYLKLFRPGTLTTDRGRTVLSVSMCPACKQSTPANVARAMDLATKGEAAFAHLVRSQVGLQPPQTSETAQTPNGGRKTLIFSDGRQKAARLARDIPREIELDLFRQAIFLAAKELEEIQKEARLDVWLYTAFLKVVADHNLTFFDGTDRKSLEIDVRQFTRVCRGDLEDALEHFERVPPAYSALLLKQLCAAYYSISALTLGYAAPGVRAKRQLDESLGRFTPAERYEISVAWTQRLLGRFGFQAGLAGGVRRQASPFPHVPPKLGSIFSASQVAVLKSRGVDAPEISALLAEALADEQDGGVYLNPRRSILTPALNRPWNQCEACKTVSPTAFLGNCVACGAPGPAVVDPGRTEYLRARKGFWREPVARAVAREERPMSIDVQEHSAQLSYKDEANPTPTTEEFERRFRDILKPDERAIDVLSCTTTMEVGIDIGSLIAVSMRNVPPMRQNYQQRAGRAGRRGSAVSTVLTYAQSSAHDAHYFADPRRILSGDPPKPVLDTANFQIAARHVNAQLLQDFFKPIAGSASSGTIFTALGNTCDFFQDTGAASLAKFREWLTSPLGQESLARAQQWLPIGLTANQVAGELLSRLKASAPITDTRFEKTLLEYLFSIGILPSYAFPRDLCALTIQEIVGNSPAQFRTVEQTQQGMNVALSEYAPGRLVVVNKKTYRVGTIAASSTDIEVDRATHLFDTAKSYQHCTECTYTAGFGVFDLQPGACPQCRAETLQTMTVVTPEVVYPRGKSAIDEFDDEQVYSQVTQAQLPLPAAGDNIRFKSFGKNALLASQRNQTLVVVNKGDVNSDGEGFEVCTSCGKVLLEDDKPGPHQRDYYIRLHGRSGLGRCNGRFERVFLGYSFPSDVLLLRIRLTEPIRFTPSQMRLRRPVEDALQTLSEAIVLAMSRTLDVDAREVSAGYRFGSDETSEFADIFIYDTLSGGAGYAVEAATHFEKIFASALESLKHCTCGSSCEKCLRHYGNRFHHANLDRHLAISLAGFIQTGNVPMKLEAEEALNTLAPLARLLELAGWLVVKEKEHFKAAQGARIIELRAIPSLRAAPLKEARVDSTCFYFTPYEIGRDLPAAYAEL